MGEAPFGHDRAAARHDAGHALRGHRDVAQQNAGVDREVVDALLGLLDQRVAVHLPGQVLGLAVDLLQRLVDRHRADRHRRVADDPLARLVDVLSGRQVHHRVAAPARRPGHLLDFLVDRRADRRVADVGVDLHQEIAADDHRLGFRMIDVGGNDRAAARHFVADEFRRDDVRNRCAEALTRMLARDERGQLLQHFFALQVLADGDELHLRRDDAASRVVHLRDVAAKISLSVPPAFARRGCRCRSKRMPSRLGSASRARPYADVRPASSSVSPRSSIQRARSGASPERMSIFTAGSV